LFRFSYTSNYSDRRIASIGTDQRPEPDAHTVSNSRARRLSFDFGVHRRIGRWGWLRDPSPPAPAGGSAAAPRPGTAPQAAAPPDTTATAPAAPKRPRPNPLKMVLRWVASIDPIKVELSDGHTASYTGLANEAGVPFRFGLTLDSGVIGARFPTPLDERRTIELGTGIPLRGALRVSTRYLRSSNDRQSRAGSGPTLKITRTPSVETTFPSLDMTINNLEKLPIWAKRMTRSSLSLGYSRATTESKTQELDASERLLRESNPRLIERTTITSNWTGQWKRDVSTNVAFSHSDNVQEVVGRKNQQMRRSINGGLRFKISPEGGLRLPLLGLLKTGVDLSFNGSWSADESRTFTDRARPDYFVVQNKVNQLLFSTRGDYTLSRNMSGGLEVGMTRSSRNDTMKQTITTVRLAFNLIFSF
jgi:hypothetical protein